MTGTCDFEFSLWDADAGPAQIGTTQTVTGVSVTSGVFTVGPPDIDFGDTAFDGTGRWLEIRVKCPPEVVFTTLAPRVELTPAPYALWAAHGVGPPGVLEVTPTGELNLTKDLGGGMANHLLFDANNWTMTALSDTGSAPMTIESRGSSGDRTQLILDGASYSATIAGQAAAGNTAGITPPPKLKINLMAATANTAAADAYVSIAAYDADDVTPVLLRLKSGDTNVLNVTTTARVGIGTDTPSEKLDVTGNIHASGTITTGNTITIDGTSGSENISSSASLEFRVDDNQPAFRILPAYIGASFSPNLVGGEVSTNILNTGVNLAFIGGGKGHRVADDGGTVAGGIQNQAGDNLGTTEDAPEATVGGGFENKARATWATVGGGFSNIASGVASTVPGGQQNQASSIYSCIGGGGSNIASAPNSTIGGGFANTASGSNGSTVGGGNANTASGIYATIGGGQSNAASGLGSTVGGGPGNTASAEASTVAGGRLNTVSDFSSTIGGGASNAITAAYATIAGGRSNAATAAYTTIAGGGPSDPSSPATILATRNLVTDEYGTVGGGGNNQAGDDAGTTSDKIFATVGGGISNTASGGYSTIGGGVGNTASAERCTIGGGDQNQATGLYSTVGGGGVNAANGRSSTVPGGELNTAGGDYSFAAGRRAKANLAGSFVWADSNDADFASTAVNQFFVRAAGGSTIYSDAGLTAGVTLAAGGGSWSSVSDRNLKENFAEIDKEALLEKLIAIPVTTWNYKSQDQSIRHMGPMGQDFHAAFGVGETGTRITTIDADGVALAAIQGLYEIVKEKDCEIEELRSEIEKLKEAVNRRP